MRKSFRRLSFRHPGPSALRHGARASRHLIVRDVAGLIVGVLLLLSWILMATTLFPDIDVVAVTGYLALAMVVLAAAAILTLRWLANRQPKSTGPETLSHAVAGVDRISWRMPTLTLLQPVTWSAGTRLGMLDLRGYLIVGASAARGESHPTRPRMILT